MTDKRKQPTDISQRAKLIVDIAAGEVEDRPPTSEEEGKNPAGVALGRLGGAKGGKARAAGVSDQLWEIGDIVKLVEDAETKPGKRGPYKKRAAL